MRVVLEKKYAALNGHQWGDFTVTTEKRDWQWRSFIEDKLRTYMINGTSLEELEKEGTS